jgi:hypothetical protein
LYHFKPESDRFTKGGEKMGRPYSELLKIDSVGDTVDAKKCSICKQIKPLTGFRKKLDGPLGVTSACKECLVKTPPKMDHNDLMSLTIDGSRYLAKKCKKCNEVKILNEFPQKSKGGIGGRYSQCKSCVNGNPYKKKHSPSYDKVRKAKRKALEMHLVKCELTDSITVHLEHFIPVSWGHGGSEG